MLCAPLDWQCAELPSQASDTVLCTVLVVRSGSSNQILKKKEKKEQGFTMNKEEFRDALALRYDRNFKHLPSKCDDKIW